MGYVGKRAGIQKECAEKAGTIKRGRTRYCDGYSDEIITCF